MANRMEAIAEDLEWAAMMTCIAETKRELRLLADRIHAGERSGSLVSADAQRLADHSHGIRGLTTRIVADSDAVAFEVVS